MTARIDELAQTMTSEMGKRIGEARGEVEFSARILDYYAENAERFLAPVELNPTVGTAHMESSPIGVIFCVEPWNFPYYQLARVAGPHLMAGNVLMVKHAGIVPQCAIAFEKLLTDAGAPAGLYTNLFISHEQSARIVDDPRIKGVALTGSVAAGETIAARAGQNVKISSMELGGSDAFIVLDDADLDHTIPWAVWGRMYNDGQTCCAAKRFIVAEGVADKFLERFQAALTALEPGDPMDEETTLGPLSTESALVDLLKQVDGAVASGAKVVMGGKRIDRPGSFMEPTILTDIAPENPAFRQEFFGPVALMFRVKDDDAAIALANDSDFGLGGSVWTQGRRPRRTPREPGRDGHDVHQQHRLVRRRTALRRHQELGLRSRARRHGHPGVRQQEARAGRVDGGSRLTPSRLKANVSGSAPDGRAIVNSNAPPNLAARGGRATSSAKSSSGSLHRR